MIHTSPQRNSFFFLDPVDHIVTWVVVMYARTYLECVTTLVLYLSCITNSSTSLSRKNTNICRTLYSLRHRVVRLLLTAIIMIVICFIHSFSDPLLFLSSSPDLLPVLHVLYVGADFRRGPVRRSHRERIRWQDYSCLGYELRRVCEGVIRPY